MAMQFSLRDMLVLITFVAFLCAFVAGETVDVIWALVIYGITSIAGLVLTSLSVARLLQDLHFAVKSRSVFRLLGGFQWRIVLLDFSGLFLLIVAVVTANYARNEASGLNAVLFVSPAVAVYFVFRWFGFGHAPDAEKRGPPRQLEGSGSSASTGGPDQGSPFTVD